ncbi:MAG: hypothetical protein KGI33_07455 [Thaumarchaeota archaeon]|nr:hypothetical protein [Nitrososphaerota archaeon]
MTTVVSAKIPDELGKKAKLHHIKISQVVKKAIEEEVRRVEEKSLSADLGKMGRILRKKVSSKEIVRAVRSSGNER